MPRVTEGLVDELRDDIGDGIRTVATCDRGEYDLRFIRDDVDAEYSEEEISRLFQQVEIEGMGYAHFEELFHTGELECAIYGFEGALMFQLPVDEFSGLFVTTDRDIRLNPESVIGICKEAIE